MGYTKDAIKGISWIAVLRASTRAIAFVKTIILARILMPSQFGAYGVALLVLSFLEVMTETGVNVLLIQEKETDNFINSAWLVSIIRGMIISIVIIISTPLIISFYNSPESQSLLYAISIVPFLRGFINPAVIKLQKELKFNKEFGYRFSIFAFDSAVAITSIIITRNPLGIVYGVIAGVMLEIILSFIMIKPTPVIALEKAYILKILNRGKWVTASGIFNYLFHNADNIIVGRLMGTTSLGIYQIAYSLSILPITEIADVFSRVTFPVYTKIAGDKERLRKAFLKTQMVISALTIPFGLILILFPTEIVTLIFGEKWLGAVAVLPILAVFSILRTISGSVSTLFLAVEKQEYVTAATLISIVGLLIPIVPLVTEYGIFGAALSALIGSVVAAPVFAYYAWKILSTHNEKR